MSLEGRTYLQRQDLETFWEARGGIVNGFRFKSWQNYTTLAVKHDLVELTATTFQFVLRGTSGAQTVVRNIYLPLVGTVHVYNGVTEILSGFTINYLTGVCTFSVDPAYTPSATFEYDVPVTFDSDLSFVAQYPLAHTLEEFAVIELLA